MTGEMLFEVIGDIEEQYIVEAEKVKKKKLSSLKWIGIAACICILFSTFSLAQSGLLERWGKYLAGKSQNETQKTIYAKGNNAVIYLEDLEQATVFYKIAGMTDEAARQQAIAYAMEEAALYQEALKRGYSVTDKEVDTYLEELKELVKTADNFEDILSVINQFESEDAYWDYQKFVYKKSLPIMQMNRDNEEKYWEEHPEASQEQYQEWFANWKKALVDAEQFEIVK